MKLHKEEIRLVNGFNQFNLVDERDLIVAVVAGFTNEQNLKNATLFEHAPEMLEMLKKAYENLSGDCPNKIFEEIEKLIKKAI